MAFRPTLTSKRPQQLRKRLLPLAQDSVVHRGMAEHPMVVGGDFRPAQDDPQLRPLLLEPLGDPQRALDVPHVAREADHPRLPRKDFLHQPLVAQRIGQRRGEQVDLIPGLLQPAVPGKELQIPGGQRDVVLDRLWSRRRDGKLGEQDRTRRGHTGRSHLAGGLARRFVHVRPSDAKPGGQARRLNGIEWCIQMNETKSVKD